MRRCCAVNCANHRSDGWKMFNIPRGKCSIQHRVRNYKHPVIYKHKGSFYYTHWASLTSVCYAVYQDAQPLGLFRTHSHAGQFNCVDWEFAYRSAAVCFSNAVE